MQMVQMQIRKRAANRPLPTILYLQKIVLSDSSWICKLTSGGRYLRMSSRMRPRHRPKHLILLLLLNRLLTKNVLTCYLGLRRPIISLKKTQCSPNMQQTPQVKVTSVPAQMMQRSMVQQRARIHRTRILMMRTGHPRLWPTTNLSPVRRARLPSLSLRFPTLGLLPGRSVVRVAA